MNIKLEIPPDARVNDPTIPIIGAPKLTALMPGDLEKIYAMFGMDLKEFGAPQGAEYLWLFLLPIVHKMALGIAQLRGEVDGLRLFIEQHLQPPGLPGEKPIVDEEPVQ
jgi:hypothetical protein